MADEGTRKGSMPSGIVDLCDWFWKQRALVGWTIGFSIASGIFTGWLFADPSSVAKLPSYWFYEHRFAITIALLVLIFLFILSGVVRLVPASKSEYALKRKYLDKLIGEQMMLALSGIPTGLVQQSIWLEKIFIHLHFHPAPPTNIQSLDEEEQARISQRRAKGSQAEVLTRLMIEARNEREIREAQTVDITEVWQRLTRDEPAAVIQGYPGIGKSTLLSRITLCMARRSLYRPDPDTILSALQPAQIPLFVSLKEYARSYNNTQLSLLAFIRDDVLKQLLPYSDVVAIAPLIEHWLDNGLCLVLFDGLDEAANESDDMRRTVQKEIRQFISRYRHRERTTGDYNRFLVTSRIAGYDRDAFLPDRYPNYIIAYLQEEQIAHFLPRWCTANVHPAEVGVSKETLQQQADKAAERLLQAVRTNRGVKKLAQTPLLLTLMAAMQKKGTELPRSRAELYTRVTETLLDKRNEDKGMSSLPVGEAVQRLGPLACLMHEQDYGLATKQEVLKELAGAINTPQGGGGLIENVRLEAENYLKRLSERGGMLVKRTSDFYGFFHRTFEEYFAARHVLNKIELQEIESTDFVKLARQHNDLWPEPYLLAVAYKGLDGYNAVANQLVRTLFEAYRTDARPDPRQQLADLLLATTAIAESKESAIHPDLKREVADALLQRYTQALQAEVFDDCSKIEDVLSEWLLTISRDSYNPPVLEALKAAVYATADTARQRGVLTLFTMIAQRIVNGAESIFAELVPPLLTLAGYRTAVKVSMTESIEPARNLSTSPDLNIAELARAALSFLDKRGPAGASLRYVQQYFKEQPQYYHHLGRYSLENDSLITPTIVPLAEENYRQYEQAIEHWIKLRDRCRQHGIREQDISSAATIQRELLTSAEELSYPAVTYILSMLQHANADPAHWRTICRDYLLTQLNATGTVEALPYSHSPPISAIDYREIVFLYTSLFVEEQDTKLIVGATLAHYQSKDSIMQRTAQYLLVLLSEDWRYLRDLRDWRYLRDWRDIYILLFTEITSKRAQSKITTVSGLERAEILTILAGRLYALEEGAEKGDALPELKMYVSTALGCLHDRATREAALDVVRVLPTRTAAEVNYIVEVAQDAQGKDIQKDIQAACGLALRRANPQTPEIRTALERAKMSPVAAMREAANSVLP